MRRERVGASWNSHGDEMGAVTLAMETRWKRRRSSKTRRERFAGSEELAAAVAGGRAAADEPGTAIQGGALEAELERNEARDEAATLVGRDAVLVTDSAPASCRGRARNLY